MEKFANRHSHVFVALLLALTPFFFAGCATVPSSAYISRVDHPYDRKIYAGFEKVVSTFMFVLKNQGWAVTDEVDPSIYERDERYDNNGYQNLLIMTDTRKHFLNLSAVHLNVLIHSIGNSSDVEIRYEAKTSLVKQFTSVRNDQTAEHILDAVEQEVSR